MIRSIICATTCWRNKEVMMYLAVYKYCDIGVSVGTKSCYEIPYAAKRESIQLIATAFVHSIPS